MQTEMNKLFAEGGVMQQGGTVDPVSGNEVPPGAMQEEVRDDIDAKLSEGEFVIPADVVRFIGLEKLMAMRDKAKAGLQRMNDIGQMGNAEEVEDGEALFGGEEDEMDDDMFSSEIDSIMSEDSGGEEREYAKGGYVVAGNEQLYRDAPIKGFEMVPMTNDAGQTIYIPFINGVAQLSIPAGYKAQSTSAAGTPAATTPAGPVASGTPAASGGGDGGGDSVGASTGSMSVDDAGLAMGTNVSPTAVGIVGSVMGMMGIPGSTAVTAGKGFIADALSNLSTSAAASSNQAMMAAQMGLTPAEAATTMGTAATASAVDSLSSSPVGTMAATPGAAGTGGSAASAAAAAAAAAASQGAAAQGAAAQAAATATIGGASAAEAAAAGAAAANAAQAAETGMTTNAQGQTVSNDASIAAQDASVTGDSGPSSVGPSADSSAAGTADAASESNGGDGIGGTGTGVGDSSAGGGGGGGGGGCFLTTAAVEHMGHTDNGQLLNTLRDFRDTYMRKNKEASKDVAWYYENAPKIVKALDEHPDAKKIYRKMYNRFIMPSYLAIKMGKDDVAYGLYKKGINFARQEANITNEDIEPRYGKHGITDADVKKYTGLGAKSKK